MKWPWKRKIEQAEERVRAAERLRDAAQEQQATAEGMVSRVDAITSSLRKLHSDNHFGPMIDRALRGGNE